MKWITATISLISAGSSELICGNPNFLSISWDRGSDLTCLLLATYELIWWLSLIPGHQGDLVPHPAHSPFTVAWLFLIPWLWFFLPVPRALLWATSPPNKAAPLNLSADHCWSRLEQCWTDPDPLLSDAPRQGQLQQRIPSPSGRDVPALRHPPGQGCSVQWFPAAGMALEKFLPSQQMLGGCSQSPPVTRQASQGGWSSGVSDAETSLPLGLALVLKIKGFAWGWRQKVPLHGGLKLP